MTGRLARWLRAGRTLRPDEPHLYAVDAGFPAGCWCGRSKQALVHAEVSADQRKR